MSSNEPDIFPGAAEDVSTDVGMSVDDAAASAYDDQDRAHNGIAEGERESVGQYLKFHADAVGTTVINGLNSLIEPTVTLRHGSQQDKRTLLGHLVDQYQIQDVPVVQSQAIPYGPPRARRRRSARRQRGRRLGHRRAVHIRKSDRGG